ncbi:MAG: DUF6290 family protein [Actinomycetia bacterium]|nr:DUF6290 family protein [Actinomycetes bacterium]
MISTDVIVSLGEEDKEWIDSFAKLNGNSLSTQVREWTLQRLEDELEALGLKELTA